MIPLMYMLHLLFEVEMEDLLVLATNLHTKPSPLFGCWTGTMEVVVSAFFHSVRL